MHVPLWLFLCSLLLALTWHDMASMFLRRSVPTWIETVVWRGVGTGTSAGLGASASIKTATTTTITRTKAHHFSTNTTPTKQQQQQLNPSKMAGSADFLSAIKARRTIYPLKKESTIPDSKIQEIIEQAILHVPSSFNSQSTRAVLLVKEEHDQLWEITKDVLKAMVSEEQWKSTEQRLNGFKGAYGTVLFFEARSSVQAMQDKFAAYADRFPSWATQSDAMHQFVIWTALELEGLGCNLQHYNPLIDAKVQEKWGIDQDWVLNAQLVFGTPAGQAGEKSFLDLKERVKVFGA